MSLPVGRQRLLQGHFGDDLVILKTVRVIFIPFAAKGEVCWQWQSLSLAALAEVLYLWLGSFLIVCFFMPRLLVTIAGTVRPLQAYRLVTLFTQKLTPKQSKLQNLQVMSQKCWRKEQEIRESLPFSSFFKRRY